jgi:putative Ca2+/H+ antiporter (TMEM165/GDT1 family)
MEALFTSIGIVALAEIGDKTQLLSLALASRYRKPWPIIAGILVATLLNHALAGALGAWVAGLVTPQTLRWVLAASFFAMATWILVPDKLDAAQGAPGRFGVFAATTVAFFLVEMGDKTQIATVALAARYSDLAAVVGGTTAGMLIANAPVVVLGERLMKRLPVKVVHRVAAGVFLALGIAVIGFPSAA